MWAEKKEQVLQTENLWAWITGQIVFVLESFGGKATSELLLLILHMALQLHYQNFVHTSHPASYAGQKCPPPPPPLENKLKIQMFHL